jgi:hypothetical protein
MRFMNFLQEIALHALPTILPTGNLSRQAFRERSAVVARRLSERHANIAA